MPAVIYSIPPSSPLYYVTYVRVYDVTPQYVVVGYTPGYLGTVVTPGGVVVYGTGYTYVPYIGATVWYPPPVTYGYAAALAWTPWTGWAVGFGFGLAFGAAVSWSSHCCWGYCPAPYWGAMPYAHYYGGAAYGWHGSAGGVGAGRLGCDLRQRVPALGSDGRGHPDLGRVQRVDGQCVEHPGRPLLQLRHWSDLRRAASCGPERVHGELRLRRARSHLQPDNRRLGEGRLGDVRQCVHGPAEHGQRGAGHRSRRQSASAAQVGNNYYASHDGNVYRNTGSGWQHYNNGGWNSVQTPSQVSSLQAQQQARQTGDARSAGSSWGSGSWGGGFSRSDSGGGWGGFNDIGGGVSNRSSGWDRGGGGWGGGGRSWGGGGFGGRR